jgi:hypothetical protein
MDLQKSFPIDILVLYYPVEKKTKFNREIVRNSLIPEIDVTAN